jgi:hypothetical protein
VLKVKKGPEWPTMSKFEVDVMKNASNPVAKRVKGKKVQT